jgi:hypothetical protein
MKITGHLTDSVYRRYAIADEDMMREGAEKLSGLFSRILVKPARKSCLSEWEGLKMSSVPKVVGVAQLVERWTVAPVVEGSSPFTHPRYLAAQASSRQCAVSSVGRAADS